MKLGFVTAILPDLSLEEVLKFAAETGYDCVEVMCWPLGKAERRYAGVTHLDVTNFTAADAARVNALTQQYGVSISGLGYYPNPLTPILEERTVYVDHIKKVIAASNLLGVGVMNTFVGRDQVKTIDDNFPVFESVWQPILEFAESQQVKVGIENCPMLFSNDEFPGGKNMAISPDVWRRMFARFPTPYFGLNFDPSHLVWQFIDYERAIYEFHGRFVHAHAKDLKVRYDVLYERGVTGLGWSTPKLPGLGDVHWGKFFSALSDVGYKGAVCVEVEDRAYEGALADRKRSLTQSKRYLEQFMR
ncbi:MAG: sugar phosphate isomerase/epimerase [Anaerolineales bacterium]|nr:sugar phosphate isomerase/epimerase [Anaerolineales bacterium]